MIATLIALSVVGCAPVPQRGVRLLPEERTTVRVGEVAELRLPTDFASINGAWWPALSLVNHTREQQQDVYYYRAVVAGNATFLSTPKTSHENCVSCITVHWFVTVVP